MAEYLAAREPGALAQRYELEVEDLIAQVGKIQHLMAKVMKEGEHFGVIPGTGTKPTLLKPGAEKLCLLFRLAPDPHSVETYDGKHLTVKSKCDLYHIPTGQKWGSGEGSCSTKESRYAYRQGKRVCPSCGADAILRSKFPPRKNPHGEPGWYCYTKREGCGAEFVATDPTIVNQTTGRIPNEDLADQYNTVVKMSNKRALVAAVLNVTAASDIFTQDVEDAAPMPPAAHAGEVIEGEVVPSEAAPPVDREAKVRSELLDAIRDYNERLKLTDAQAKLQWARAIGPNVKDEDAPTKKLMALAAELAGRVAQPDVPF